METYTYRSVNGNTQTIRAGEDGITEEMIQFLLESDRKERLQEERQAENTSRAWLAAMIRFEQQPEGSGAESPLERIADPRADIFSILYPEEETSRPAARLEQAMGRLSESQRDLILALYGQGRTMADIAREQGVTHGAIRNRRLKILRRLEKLMAEG